MNGHSAARSEALALRATQKPREGETARLAACKACGYRLAPDGGCDACDQREDARASANWYPTPSGYALTLTQWGCAR